MPEPKAKPGIMDIHPYIGGEAEIVGEKNVIKLSSNEGALGSSARAVDAYMNTSKDLHRYPDGNARSLRQTISEVHGLDPNLIVCGSGSDELIALLCKAFSGPGDEVLYSQYGFLMYPISAMAAGATPKTALEMNYTADVDSLLQAVTKKTKILFLANPNNPTGTYLPVNELYRLHKGLREDIILVIDAAYAEFVTREDYIEGNKLVEGSNNVIVTRTFSKSHGLGGLRLGWAYGSSLIIDILNRVRGPFNVSAASQAAGIASMNDTEFAKVVRNHNLKWAEWTKRNFLSLGLETTDSVGNFVLLTFKGLGAFNAQSAETALKREGILVRSMKAYGLHNSLRISIGLEEEMRTVVHTLSKFMGHINDEE
uniref:Histidinol-phosphate aminotransferase n=1 Tax=uncultured nuHF1 cluster bacterium HF0770_35I22 TaxID=723586 RepID=E7C7P8_9BACT|nr:histidinol-phosphate/aromatic aminotransferase and cobyric acid decarboxylase [uncultured nuHF1 cluster bacterium HF0770_35I22]